MELTLPCPFKTPEFKAEFEKWNRILEQSGHKEIEDFNQKEPLLKVWECSRFDSNEGRDSHAKSAKDGSKLYYELASQLLHNGFRFKSDVHRRVWELHCSGLAARRIAEIIWCQLIGYRGTRKTNIHDIVIEIRKKAKLRNG